MDIPDKELIERDVNAYLEQHWRKDLLRFLTCGSVDDGKSTLIGRLLYDSKLIYEDQLAAVRRDSRLHGTTGTDFDPALLTDGLKAEREQGITIDVAYRYFSTSRRKFIIADTPGHEQYTRNMATGASNCDLAVILIDARHGVTTQTRRHSFIVSLLGIAHIVVAINKMDLVGWSQDVYEAIRREYNEMSARLESFKDVHFIPMSALLGDNVVERSAQMPWYQGPPLLRHLEQVNIASSRNLIDMRFPVQYVQRPNLDFRGFAGTVASGVVRVGDRVMVLPSRQTSRVKSIVTMDGELDYAFAPQAVTLTLEDEIDASRGDMLVPVNNLPFISAEFDAMLVWMSEAPAREGADYLVKHTTSMTPGTLARILYEVDVNTMRKREANGRLELNAIARVHLSMHRPLAYDVYVRNHATGSFILVDRLTNATVACGMIIARLSAPEQAMPALQTDAAAAARNLTREATLVSRRDREALLGQRARTVWLTGLSGSGKSTLAKGLELRLTQAGRLCILLDGDNVRHGLNRDLGFSADDRRENIRRVAEVARLLNDAGVIVITAFISPYAADREMARGIIGDEAFREVHVATPLAVCERRDVKGLYAKARGGALTGFTGVDAPYEEPQSPYLRLDTDGREVDTCVSELYSRLLDDLAPER